MTGKVQRRPLPVIARRSCDEAIQLLLRGSLDCFASLAMTLRDRRKPLPVIARRSCAVAIQLLLYGALDRVASLAITARRALRASALRPVRVSCCSDCSEARETRSAACRWEIRTACGTC